MYACQLQFIQTTATILQDARSRIFTDLIMHNYRSNQSALMTRCRTDFRHQYGIFGGESQTSVSRNATRPGAKKDGCFRRLQLCHRQRAKINQSNIKLQYLHQNLRHLTLFRILDYKNVFKFQIRICSWLLVGT